jgi:hypothetical protein
MAAAVTNFKRLLLVCGDRKVFIITPGLRYVIAACCNSNEHCLHMRFPDFALKLQNDLLHWLHTFFLNRLASSPNSTLIPAGDLIAQERNAQLRRSWLPTPTGGR